MRQSYSTVEAARRAGLTTDRLRQWLTHRVIVLDAPYSPQRWTERELEDLVAVGAVVRQAHEAGLVVRTEAVTDMWKARTLGLGWRVTLDTGKR